jgi:secondary thiamine-phosphate synthase enzyme
VKAVFGVGTAGNGLGQGCGNGKDSVAMEITTEQIRVSTRGNTDIIDITGELGGLLKRLGFREGHVLVFVSGSTAGLTTVEYEPGLLEDLPEAFEKLAPSGVSYHHDRTWQDGNGHAHVRASLLGPSLTIPFCDGRLLLGQWQQVILIDFDNRSRSRNVVAQFTGQRG